MFTFHNLINFFFLIRDLLSKEHLTKRLELRERPDTGVYVKDLTSFVCKSRSEIEHVMNVGNVNRSVNVVKRRQTLQKLQIITKYGSSNHHYNLYAKKFKQQEKEKKVFFIFSQDCRCYQHERALIKVPRHLHRHHRMLLSDWTGFSFGFKQNWIQIIW